MFRGKPDKNCQAMIMARSAVLLAAMAALSSIDSALAFSPSSSFMGRVPASPPSLRSRASPMPLHATCMSASLPRREAAAAIAGLLLLPLAPPLPANADSTGKFTSKRIGTVRPHPLFLCPGVESRHHQPGTSRRGAKPQAGRGIVSPCGESWLLSFAYAVSFHGLRVRVCAARHMHAYIHVCVCVCMCFVHTGVTRLPRRQKLSFLPPHRQSWSSYTSTQTLTAATQPRIGMCPASRPALCSSSLATWPAFKAFRKTW